MPGWKTLAAPLITCLLALVFVGSTPAAENAQTGAPASSARPDNPAGRDPVRVGQVELPTPPGYAEVTPERYPAYFGGAAYDTVISNRAGLVRLFVPAEDLPLLDRQEYDALRRNIQVALPGLSWPEEEQKANAPYSAEEERKAVEELSASLRAGKIPAGLADSPPNDDAVAAWLKAFSSNSGGMRDSLLFAEPAPGENYALTLGLPHPGAPVSFGLFPNRPVASTVAFCTVGDRLVLISFNRACATPDDVRALRDEAAAYMRAHARDLRLVPARGNPALESILSTAELPQRLVIDGLLRRNRPEQALAAARLFLEDCQKLAGDRSSIALSARAAIAGILQQSGRHVEAAAEFERFLADIRTDDPPPAEQRAIILAGLGRSRFALTEYVAAGEALRQALDVYAAIGQGDGLAAASARLNLGGVYAGLGDFAGAIACYKQALPIMLALDQTRSGEQRACLFSSLVSLYHRAGQRQTAFFYLRLALDIGLRPGSGHCPNDPFTEPMGFGLWLKLSDRGPELEAIQKAVAEGNPDAATVALSDSERALFLSFRKALQAVDREKSGKTGSGPARTASPARIRELSRLMEEAEKLIETAAAQKP